MSRLDAPRESSARVGKAPQPCPLEEGGVAVQVRRQDDQRGLPGNKVRLGSREATTDELGLAIFEKVPQGLYPVAVQLADKAHYKLGKVPALVVRAGVTTAPLLLDAEVLTEFELRDADGELVETSFELHRGEASHQEKCGVIFAAPGSGEAKVAFERHDGSAWIFGHKAEVRPPSATQVPRAQGPKPGHEAEVELFDAEGEAATLRISLLDPSFFVYGRTGTPPEARLLEAPFQKHAAPAQVELHDADGELAKLDPVRLDQDFWVYGRAGKGEQPALVEVPFHQAGADEKVELRDADGEPSRLDHLLLDPGSWVFGGAGTTEKPALDRIALAQEEPSPAVELHDANGETSSLSLIGFDGAAFVYGSTGAVEAPAQVNVPRAPEDAPLQIELRNCEGEKLGDFASAALRADHDPSSWIFAQDESGGAA